MIRETFPDLIERKLTEAEFLPDTCKYKKDLVNHWLMERKYDIILGRKIGI